LSDEPRYEDLRKRVQELEHIELVRKQTEEELTQTFSMSLDMICIADLNSSIFLKVNSSFTEILGYSEKELLEIPYLDFVHPDDIDNTRNVLEQKLQSGVKVYNFENRYRCKDRSYRWLSWVSHPNPEKGIAYAIARDITERKNVEELQKHNTQRYEKAQRIGRVGNWELDLKTRKFWGSEEAKRIYGFDPQKEFFTAEEVENCIPDRQRVQQALINLIENGQPYNLEFEIRTLAGPEKKYVKSIAEVVVNESGTPVKVDGVILDITDLKLVDKKLRKSEEKYRQLFHSIKDSILVADTNRNIIDCNQTFRECFGYSKEEIIGRQTACLYWSKEEFLRTGKKLQDNFELDGKNFTYNATYKKKSGEIFPGETNAFFLKNDKGERVGFIGITRDITHRKMVEESLQKADEELGRKAVELEDTNTALKVLLQKREQDNLELQENIYSNFETMITPFLDKLKNRLNNSNQQNLLDIIATNLQEIVAPFAKKLTNPMMSLTSSEIQIATMIKQGYSNKEISTILNSSKRTIDTHRQNIRKKLQLKNEKINLRTYLMNL